MASREAELQWYRTHPFRPHGLLRIARDWIACPCIQRADLLVQSGALPLLTWLSQSSAEGTNEAVHLAQLRNSSGNAAFPGVAALGGTLLGLPVLVSASANGLIAAIDQSVVVIADDGDRTVAPSTTREASVEMQSSPTNPPTSATVMVSFFFEATWSACAPRLSRVDGKARGYGVHLWPRVLIAMATVFDRKVLSEELAALAAASGLYGTPPTLAQTMASALAASVGHLATRTQSAVDEHDALIRDFAERVERLQRAKAALSSRLAAVECKLTREV